MPRGVPALFLVRARWQRVPLRLRRAVIAVVPRESLLGNTLYNVTGRLIQAGRGDLARDLVAWFCPTLIPCRTRSALIQQLARQPGEALTEIQWMVVQATRRGFSLRDIAAACHVHPRTVGIWLREGAPTGASTAGHPERRSRRRRWTRDLAVSKMHRCLERHGPSVRSVGVWDRLRLTPSRSTIVSLFSSWEAAWARVDEQYPRRGPRRSSKARRQADPRTPERKGV